MDRKVVEVSSLSLSFFLFLWLSTYLPIYRSIYLSIFLSMYVSLGLVCVCLSIYLSICKLETMLFYETSSFFPSWQHQKHSTSVRLPHFLKLTTSKTKQVCETSWFFEVDHIKNEAILRDLLISPSWQHHKRSKSARLLQFFNLTTSKTKQFCETSFKNGKLSAELTASYQCVLPFFQSTCRKYCACHEKVMPGHTKCCTCHAKSTQQTWRSDAPECNPSQDISALTS